MKYRCYVSVNIMPVPEGGDPSLHSSNALYHNQTFDLEGATFSDIAVTIDGLYSAVQGVVERHGQ